jgi:hypothetical protein
MSGAIVDLEVWRRLPMLLTRKQVLTVAGLNRYDLEAAVQAGHVRTYRAHVKRKFLKVDIAKLVGVEV